MGEILTFLAECWQKLWVLLDTFLLDFNGEKVSWVQVIAAIVILTIFVKLVYMFFRSYTEYDEAVVRNDAKRQALERMKTRKSIDKANKYLDKHNNRLTSKQYQKYLKIRNGDK